MRTQKRRRAPSPEAAQEKEKRGEEIGLYEKKWEDMYPDLLGLIFSKFGDVGELMLTVWSVCPEWNSVMCDFLFRKKAGTLDLGALETMRFSSDQYLLQRLLVVTMNTVESHLPLEEIIFPRGVRFFDTHLLYVALRSKGLRRLSLAAPEDLTGKGFSRTIRNWNGIEEILLGQLDDLFIEHIIMELSINCKNLEVLCLYDCFLDEFYAPVLSKYLRQLEVLRLHWVFFSKPAIKWLLSKCPKLKLLELSNCKMYVETGKWFDENGQELICYLTYKREIKITRIQGSKPVNWSIDGEQEGYTPTELVCVIPDVITSSMAHIHDPCKRPKNLDNLASTTLQ